jgi:hypothetical protein
MDLRFAAPTLRQLDTLGGELLACGLFEDERPARGLAGLVDWRLAARISRYIEDGALTGSINEVALLAARPRLTFEKLVIFGLGPRSHFDEQVCAHVFAKMIDTFAGLKVRMAFVERPGRHTGKVDAVRAVELLVQACANRDDQDTWTLLESPQDQKRIAQHLAEQRRRNRLR